MRFDRAERLRTHRAEQPTWGTGHAVTVTVGVATWDSGGPDQLVSRADGALYAGKAAGRDNVQLATSTNLTPRVELDHA